MSSEKPQAGWSRTVRGLLLPAWGFVSLGAHVCAYLVYLGVARLTLKYDLLFEQSIEERDLTEHVVAERTVTEDPTLDSPGFEDSKMLERVHSHVLFFLDALKLDHLIDAVVMESNYVMFLGARMYVVPNPGTGPDRMFETWYRRSSGWERTGVFGVDWKAIEHVYVSFVRNRVRGMSGARGTR